MKRSLWHRAALWLLVGVLLICVGCVTAFAETDVPIEGSCGTENVPTMPTWGAVLIVLLAVFLMAASVYGLIFWLIKRKDDKK